MYHWHAPDEGHTDSPPVLDVCRPLEEALADAAAAARHQAATSLTFAATSCCVRASSICTGKAPMEPSRQSHMEFMQVHNFALLLCYCTSLIRSVHEHHSLARELERKFLGSMLQV